MMHRTYLTDNLPSYLTDCKLTVSITESKELCLES